MKQTILIVSILCVSIGMNLINKLSLDKRIDQLEYHHQSTEYSYAIDCVREAELKYWETKSLLVTEIQNYIDQIAPTSNLRAYAIVEECEKYQVDIKFVLAQGEIESHFGTKGLGSKLNNVFNVGVFDGYKAEQINNKYKFDHPNQSIEPYIKLLINRYLVNKLEIDLMENYVDVDGNRYASNTDYENIFKSKYNYISNNTNIDSLQLQLKNYAIKCGR
jgi:hypothetical protein